MNDELIFAEESDDPSVNEAEPWKVLIVDDEKGIHSVTRLALRDLRIDDRPLECLSAYSAKQALEIFDEHRDIAMCLLDVVMETDHAGLDVARELRESMGIRNTRIVLRTGQPGHAPERTVFTDYDINGYAEKAELTATRLFSITLSMIRAYRDLVAMDEAREALRRIILLSHELSDLPTIKAFADAALAQVGAILKLPDLFCAMAIGGGHLELELISWPKHADATIDEAIRSELSEALASGEKAYRCASGNMVVRADCDDQTHVLLRVLGHPELSDSSLDLLQLYCENIALAMEKIRLKQQI